MCTLFKDSKTTFCIAFLKSLSTKKIMKEELSIAVLNSFKFTNKSLPTILSYK